MEHTSTQRAVACAKANFQTMETLFGNKLLGWTDFADHQLLRQPIQKAYEASILLTVPRNFSFLDVGAHYGDTILGLALYAKKCDRNDIKFFAFEPSVEKCAWIRKISNMNDLNITIFNNCVGKARGRARIDGIILASCGASSFVEDECGNVETIALDDIAFTISPVGLMHVDVEGWEASVLKGSSKLLNDPQNQCHVLLECWDEATSLGEFVRGRVKGVMSATPEKDIVDEMQKFNHVRLPDIVEHEKNLVFRIEQRSVC